MNKILIFLLLLTGCEAKIDLHITNMPETNAPAANTNLTEVNASDITR